MNDQNFGEYFIPSDSVERTDQYTNSPAVNSDAFADNVPVDAALIHETPMGGTVAAVGPMNEPRAYETPMYETPVEEIPMGEANVPEAPKDETTPYRAPLEDEAIPYQAPVVSESIPYKAPMDEAITHEAPVVTNAVSSVALLNHEESEHFRTRWNQIQGTFVDDPRSAVQQADSLVSEVIQQITQAFANEHSTLEGQWKQGEDVSTEDLRKALQHYRSFFNRLVV